MAQIITDSNNYDDSLFDILNDADITAKTHVSPLKYEESNLTISSETLSKEEDNTKNEMLEQIDGTLEAITDEIILEPIEEKTTIIESANKSSRHKERENITKQNLCISPLLKDADVTKIYIQNYKAVYVEKNNEKELTSIRFESEEALKNELNTLCEEIVERYAKTPFYSEILIPGGIRITRVDAPLSPSGTMATISLPNINRVKGKDFVNENILTKEMLYFLERCVRGGINIIVSGNEKEIQIELLNLLNSFIPESDSIIAIDSNHELSFSHDNASVINSSLISSKESGYNAFYIATQLKPDRITINELNSDNIIDFLYSSSMNSKCYSAAIYANSPKNMCTHRIPFLYKMALNNSSELEYLPTQINESLQILVHITKVATGEYKVTNICHADGVGADGNVTIKDIFQYNRQKGEFEQPGYIPKKIIKIIKDKNIIFDDEIFKKE